MLSSKQFELARLMTHDTSSDLKIANELSTISLVSKASASLAIDNLLKAHDLPFYQGFQLMTKDFADIARQFSISPATLFCIYMESK